MRVTEKLGPASGNPRSACLESASVAIADVDAYLSRLEEPTRGTLQTLRRTILEIVPEAEEVISYRVPAFRWEVRPSLALPPFETT